MKRSKTYDVWAAMIQRCTNSNNPNYPRYGGRGITVCDRWRTFENFLADMGERPAGLSIEREDNDGHYAPGNCRWATRAEQASNTRRNVKVTLQGQTKTVSEWCRDLGLNVSTVFKRISRSGWSPEKALTTTKLWSR